MFLFFCTTAGGNGNNDDSKNDYRKNPFTIGKKKNFLPKSRVKIEAFSRKFGTKIGRATICIININKSIQIC